MKSEVYNQSTCLVSQIAYQYYIEEKKRSEIAEYFGLSPSTISRVLKRAKEEGIIQLKIAEPYLECNLMERFLEDEFGLKSVCIVPLQKPEEQMQEEYVKKQVALEGARYIQRIIRNDDVIGMAWGGTMYHLIQYLNPCRKVNANIITMHGSIARCSEKLEVKTLVDRAAMAFGGQNLSLEYPGIYENAQECQKVKQLPQCQEIFNLYKKIDISITGVGSMYPDCQSLLARTDYLTDEEITVLKEHNVCSDLMLRFIDENGEECDTLLKDRTLSIDLESYKKIPCKVVVASGSEKAFSIRSLLRGNLIDVLIIDYYLAKELINVLK